MTKHWAAWVVLSAGLALAAGGATAALSPTRTIKTDLPVQDLALTGRSVAYVADTPPGSIRCARIGLWYPVPNRRFVFDGKEQCREQASTGQGVWDIAVATRRLLWITYTGGNFREWSLWTATTTRRSPRRLRFVSRDVDAPPPIVIGPAFHDRIPYAVDREVVLLGDDGRTMFKTTVRSQVRLIAAGPGTPQCHVAVFLASGDLLCLDGTGAVTPSGTYPPRSVKALGLLGTGAVIQVGGEVVQPGVQGAPNRLTLPPGASMVDLGQERIAWERNGDLGTSAFGPVVSVRLVDGSPARPVRGRLSPIGLAWAQGLVLRWRSGRLP